MDGVGECEPNHCATGPSELIHFALVLSMIIIDEVSGREGKGGERRWV